MTSGPDFYDEDAVFEQYQQGRQRHNNPNDTIEKPIFMELLGDYQDKNILDLGCGTGTFGVELLENGCSSYTGIEASHKMFEAAQANLLPVGGNLHHATIQDWHYPPAAFDIVISRLALHYVDNIAQVFANVHQTLQPLGRFIFSTEHPVLTSSNQAATKSGKRFHWIVDNYYQTGLRNVAWKGSEVIKYHRTIEDVFIGLQQAGFKIEHLRESRPRPEMFADEGEYQRRLRIPLFIMFAAQKS